MIIRNTYANPLGYEKSSNYLTKKHSNISKNLPVMKKNYLQTQAVEVCLPILTLLIHNQKVIS